MLQTNQRILLGIVLLIIQLTISCSGNNNEPSKEIVLTVNDFQLTRNEFQTQCAQDLEHTDEFKASPKRKQEVANRIIKKELLIQEATNMGLDQDPLFMAAIEKYWEATLIKLLMEKKSIEIEKSTLVSHSEIQKKYNEYKSKNSALPSLDRIEKEIAIEIREQRKTDQLEEWISHLHKKAKIKIDDKIYTD